MAFLFGDTFDTYQTADIAKRWTTVGGAVINTTHVDRGQAMQLSNTFTTKTVAPGGAGDKGLLGMKFYPTAGPPDKVIIDIYTTAGPQFRVQRNYTDGTISIYRSNGMTLLATSASSYALNTLWHLEIKWTIANSGGTIEVRVNGAPSVSYTGDTQQQTASTWSSVQLMGYGCWIDSFYLLDQEGAACHDWLGPTTGEYLPAQPGNGTHADFTPSSGSDRGAMVDDHIGDGDFPDEASTFNASSTVGHRDTYTLTDLSVASATIHAVQTVICAKKSDSGTRTYVDVLYSGSTTYDGATAVAPSDTSYAYGHWPHETDPATGVAWTVSGVNALEAGQRVAS